MARFSVSLPAYVPASLDEIEDSEYDFSYCSCNYYGSQLRKCNLCRLAEIDFTYDYQSREENDAWNSHYRAYNYKIEEENEAWEEYYYGDDDWYYGLLDDELEELAPETFVNSFTCVPRKPLVYPLWYYLPAKPAGRGSRAGVKHWRRSNGDIHDGYNRRCKMETSTKAARRDFSAQIDDLINPT